MVDALVMSQAQLKEEASAKWQTARPFVLVGAGMLFSIPIALLPFAVRGVQPTAEFFFLVAVPGVWNCIHSWITPLYLYVILNLVIVTLVVKSGALSLASGRSEYYGYTVLKLASDQTSEAKDFYSQRSIAGNYELKVAFATEIQSSSAASVPEREVPNAKGWNPVPCAVNTMQLVSSSLRKSSTKLVNLGSGGELCGQIAEQIAERVASESAAAENIEECSSTTHLVVFEICAEPIDEDPTEDQQDPDLSAEELFVKAENFIQNFKRQLKIQREDSWKRLHRIYKQSC